LIIQPVGSLPLLSPLSAGTASASAVGGQSGFASLLSQAMQGVNSTIQNAEQQGIALASGTATNVASVMESATQAQLAIDMTVQVRNRVVQAYSQIMSMQV